MQKLIYIISLILLLLSFVTSTSAQAYKTIYEIEYTIKNQNTLSALIKTSVTNLKGDLYLKDFTLGLPKNIKLSKLTVSDDLGPVTYRVKSDSRFNLISLDFNQPKSGIGAINNIYLSFDDNSLLTSSPFLWELILPTITIDQLSTLTVKLKTDIDFDKKITLSKPTPSRVDAST